VINGFSTRKVSKGEWLRKIDYWTLNKQGIQGPDFFFIILRGLFSVLKNKGKNKGINETKWMQHRDFPGGHPSQYYSGPKALNFRVLMGSGVVALV
jgi:hypothetical protein